MKRDLIIIGGGAAGIIAAISAKKQSPDLDIVLVEKNEKLGKKILVCGAGRCNVTNTHVATERYYGAPKKFIGTVINQFDNKSIIKFLNDIGVELYEEEKNGRKKGKVFPVTNQAATVADLLESELKRLNIEVLLDADVTSAKREDFLYTVKIKNKEKLVGRNLIIAAGGKTYPQLGATGKGYLLAQEFGHTIIEPVPSALPLEVEHWMILRLSGVRIHAEVTSIINGEKIKTDTDEMMFSSYGLTGPVILNISREISVRLNRDKVQDCKLSINFFPGYKKEEVVNIFKNRWESKPDQEVLYSLYGLLPNKMAKVVLDFLKIDKTKKNADLTKNEIHQILDILCEWKVIVSATRTWSEGEFTAGGVDTKQLDSSTLESKIVPNLYFAGEVVNVDGDVGGFNLSWAWASGWVAGKSVI